MSTSENGRRRADATGQQAAEAAASVFEQIFSRIDDLAGQSGPEFDSSRRHQPAPGRNESSVDGWLLMDPVPIFADVVRELAGFAELTEASRRPASTDGFPITLHGLPGQQLETTLWLHNLTDTTVTGIVPRMTRLTPIPVWRLSPLMHALRPRSWMWPPSPVSTHAFA